MDIFEIIGPIMIGPSSSHTAGAARIGMIARRLLGEEVKKADIGFHGSFAKTYKGHGTDRAILGGLMGMAVDDENLRNSLKIAREKGLEYSFRSLVIREAHQNTVALNLTGIKGGSLSLIASSIGGGRIEVKMIEGMEASFTGEMPTLIVRHQDKAGTIAKVCTIVGNHNINIARMRDFRKEQGGGAVMVLELDEIPSKDIIDELIAVPNIVNAVMIDAL